MIDFFKVSFFGVWFVRDFWNYTIHNFEKLMLFNIYFLSFPFMILSFYIIIF
jgi:hypothetical protein